MALNAELLKILVCPKCKGEIHLNVSQDGLVCRTCSLLYPIVDEIPVMLIEEAKPISQNADE
ncbi:MAG: Trm112 family protein [Thermodesulfobacteriota bacterium]